MSDGEQSEVAGIQRAPLNTAWVIKMVVIIVVLVGLGAYGYYDATVAYPNRGEAYSSHCQWQYLQTLKEANAEEFGIFAREASVPDPVASYELLNDPETLARIFANAADPSSTSNLRDSARLARLEWFRGLNTIGQMTPERTTIENPQDALNKLASFWATQESPKKLASYDILSQWLITLISWGVGALMMLLMFKTVLKRYSWDPAEQRLMIPGGKSFVPSDLAEIDKRKWDKFIVFLRLKEGHELGTGELRFDTYRHARLEGWILEMEEARFGPQEEDEGDAPADESSSPTPEPDSEADDSDKNDDAGTEDDNAVKPDKS